MSVTFNRNLEYAAIGLGLNSNTGYGGYVGLSNGNSSAITIYSGTQPTAATILSSWASYNSGNASFLAHYTGAQWTQALSGTANFTSITTFPGAVSASHSGTATWGIIWPTNPALSGMASGTIPSDYFLVCNVSTLPGTGIIKFDPNLTFTQGASKAIADGAISATIA